MKNKFKKFKLDYLGFQKEEKYSLSYHEIGDYSVTIEIQNFIEPFSANEKLYYKYHDIFNNIIKILGSKHTIQKHDILPRKKYIKENSRTNDFLEEAYFNHFNGREIKRVISYLTITKKVKRSSFFQYNSKDYIKFNDNIDKIINLLDVNNFKPRKIEAIELKTLVKRFLGMEFRKDSFSLQNFKVESEHIEFGKEMMRSVSLIDLDELNMPESIKPYNTIGDSNNFPRDLFSFLIEIQDCELIIYHQVIDIPDQILEKKALQQKAKKHSSMPDPANDFAVQDIENVLNTIAKTNDVLVNCHYNFVFYGMPNEVNNAINQLENNLFDFGFVPSHNDYNQKELYQSIFPGHSASLKQYNKFKTTADVACSLLYKEGKVQDEGDILKIYYTDRYGLPVSVDTNETPYQTGRITNFNKFVLGPTGSGKSFYMNATLNQFARQDTEIVIVDTGHSYEGLCSYHNGKYITHTTESPVTMNPFKIKREEYNKEKKTFLITLISLLWKGAEGNIEQIETSAIIECLNDYYTDYFDLNKKTVKSLKFDTFYDFSIKKMKEIRDRESVNIKVEDYAYILKKFTSGYEYGDILNSDIDKSLFEQKFIVFEIDNIKEDKILFPIITLVIMDVFLQKMRFKKTRKVLVIEEAWKAIASPLMAVYILYLYKTVRKFLGEIILVTQELNDIIGNEVVKDSVLINSDTIVLLDQRKLKDNYSEVANLLSLNDVEQRKIFTINDLDNKSKRGKFKEVYIKRGNEGEVYGVEVSREEYLIFTTDRREKESVKTYVKCYGSYAEGIKNYLNDMDRLNMDYTNFPHMVNKSYDELLNLYRINSESEYLDDNRELLLIEDIKNTELKLLDFFKKKKEELTKINKVA